MNRKDHPTEEEHRSAEQAYWKWQINTEEAKNRVSKFTFGFSVTATLIAVLAFWQTWRQTDIANITLTAVQRAYVEPVGVTFDPVRDASGKIAYWNAYMTIQDTGITPTRFLRVNGAGVVFYRAIWHEEPEKFLLDYPLGSDFSLRLGPQEKFTFGPIRVNLSNLDDADPESQAVMAAHGGRIGPADTDTLFWGYAEYNDVFPNTLRHITRFCYRLLATDQAFTGGVGPMGFPDTVKTPSTIPCNRYNCIDEECKRA